MAKGFAIHNAPTDHGGLIPATQMRDSQMNNAFVRAGDGHFCPKCKVWSTIIKSHDHVIIDGKPVAYVGDKLTCGARIQPQQSHVVGDSGGASYRFVSNSRANQIQPIRSKQELNNSFTSRKSIQTTLNEDDTLLTESESNQLFMRCFKKTVNPVTIEHRKLATEMYWEIINADEGGMTALQYLFEGFFKKPKKTAKTVSKDEAQRAYDHAKNSARMKYFKVRSSGDIDGRIGDAGQAVIAGVQAGYKSRFELLNAGL
jgi:uncharacterized Zn-binding protein involved in type VI secretion